MIDQAPDAGLVEVLRLTDRDRAALAPYLEQVALAQQAAANAFRLLLSSRVDFATQDAQLTPDGQAVLVRPRPPAKEG